MRLALVMGVIAVFTAQVTHGESAAAATESDRLRQFLDQEYERALVRSPMLATEFNDRTGADRWDDISQAGLATEARAIQRSLYTALNDFHSERLDERAELQRQVFVDQQRLLLERYRWRNHFYALNQIVGLHIAVPDLLTNQQPLGSAADARLYIRRVRAVDVLFDQLVARMHEQAAQGVAMPKSVYPLLIEAAENVIRGEPHDRGPDSPIYADFRRRLAGVSMAARQREALMRDCRSALTQRLEPAYRRLIAELNAQQAVTPVTGGVWQLPEGEAFYAFLVRQFTTTTMTPAEIHELGLQEVSRLQTEMTALLHGLGYEGTLREFVARTKSDPRFYEENTDAGRARYMARAQEIVARMQARTTEAFLSVAPLPLELKRTEPYKEASAPSGFYEGGSADGARPGVVYLNLADMRLNPTYELEDLLYHEGVPGHHLQISTILVDRSIPRLRKISPWWQNSAFVEGWGLYAEQLAKDMGCYEDAYADFGRLSGELWRATRLVVDSGLHYKRWSREQAIRYLNENTPSPEATNAGAVDRYLAVPGQATSFTVGMRTFIAERERARAALGERFDVREYHRVALQNGYVPLWALQQVISGWIAQRRLAEPQQ